MFSICTGRERTLQETDFSERFQETMSITENVQQLNHQTLSKKESEDDPLVQKTGKVILLYF